MMCPHRQMHPIAARAVVFWFECGKILGVNQASNTQDKARRPMGTLACLTAGFEIAARHVELILIPLMLDLFLWLGPRLSVGPIFERLKISLMGSIDAAAVPAEMAASADIAAVYAWIGSAFEELGAVFNLFSTLNPGPLAGVPALMPARLGVGGPLGVQPVIELTSHGLAVLAAVLLVLVGLGLNAVYLHKVARRVVEEIGVSGPGPASILVIWRQLAKLGLLYVLVVLAITLFLSLFVTIIALISGAIAGIVMTLLMTTLIFLSLSAVVHLVFTIPGMVQTRRGVLAAMRESLLLTRADFMSVIFLLGLIFIVSQGLNVVWMLPGLDSWATLIGLVGHAFVSTALTGALFVFYQERLRFLEALRQLYKARAEAQPTPE